MMLFENEKEKYKVEVTIKFHLEQKNHPKLVLNYANFKDL